MFYGVIIKMFFNDKEKHHLPHIHAEYNEYAAVFDFNANLIYGDLPLKQNKMVETWILIHQDELKAAWKMLIDSGEYYKIDPLK